MSEILFIRLGSEPESVTTVVLDSAGHLVRPAAQMALTSDVSRLAEGRQVCVLVPGEDVVSTQAAVPKASASRLRQMLPYSLEESFAADIDELQFAAGQWNEQGRLAVSVVSRSLLEQWIGMLATAGISPRSLYSTADGVPDTPATVNLILEGRTTYGRRPGEAPFVLADLRLPDLWELLEAQREDRSDLQHVMVHVDREALEQRRPEIVELRARVGNLELRELSGGCLPRMAASLVHQPGVNLLQGDFAPKSNLRALARPWYAAAGLLLALGAVALAGQAAEYFKLRGDDRFLTEQATNLCAEHFSSRLLSACRSEMQRRLSEAGQTVSSRQEDFLSALAVVANAASNDMQIEALSYRNNVMDLELILPGVSALDEFDQRVASSSRFEVRMLTNTPEDSGIKSRVQVVGSRP